MSSPAAATAPAVPSKKSERTEKPEGAPLEDAERAPAAAATAPPAPARTAPEKPKESPSQLEAKALRGKLGHLVAALAPDGSQFPRMGAAILIAYLAADRGLGKTATMGADEVRAWSDGFRRQYPMPWGAAMGVNIPLFVTGLVLASLVDAPDEEAQGAIRREFHSVMSKLAPL